MSGRRRRWSRGIEHRLCRNTMRHYTQVMCWCSERLAVQNARPFWEHDPPPTVCPKCGREHRTRFVVESREAKQ